MSWLAFFNGLIIPPTTETVTGYLHPRYPESLAGLGVPHELLKSKGWILERQISGSPYRDAMGCYPIFVCQDWSDLKADLDQMGDDLISLAVVTDPFGAFDLPYLKECFPDVTVPFKEHFVVDLRKAPSEFVHAHHLRNARKALLEIEVVECPRPSDYLDEWTALYDTLKEKHDITGISAFSRASFEIQLQVPGIVAFRALQDDTIVGMLLWYCQDNRAYYHLGAYSARGYEIGASFALFSYSLDYFALQGLEWLNLGAGAGTEQRESGLSRFKRGWSTGVRMAYFCGRIFDHHKYHEIVRAQGIPPTKYFPAYRAGEFS